jgi:hypothetical protein
MNEAVWRVSHAFLNKLALALAGLLLQEKMQRTQERGR